jgi:hypothetical protein
MNIRQCYKCKEHKEECNFKVKHGKITNCCKLCNGRYYSGRKWQGGTRNKKDTENKTILSHKSSKRKKTSEELLENYRCKQKRNKKNKFDRNCRYVAAYLLKNPCMDCGEANIIVLDFVHRDPKSKICQISDLLYKSIPRIQSEIEKCDVVCSNCHRIRTAKMFGSWRLQYCTILNSNGI